MSLEDSHHKPIHYMFCLTFPLSKQCKSTVRRDVTGSYICYLKGSGFELGSRVLPR